MAIMKAVVVRAAGGPDVLTLEDRPVPTPKPGEVLIRVKAFGLNRSELFTRRGWSPDVAFPRVLGIEAVGVVEAAPGGEVPARQVVATAMGGMGRAFDGGYAEYACVPAGQVRVLRTDLPWEVLGALPEMMQTAWGSIFTSLDLQPGERLLIRGGTTSVGLAAASLARTHGARVLATTRDPARETMLREAGADEILVDAGAVADDVRRIVPDGVDKVLEMVGVTTLADSLKCARRGGVVCMTGIVGDKWTLDAFSPMATIPKAVRLTSYGGSAEDFMRTPLQQIVEQIAAGHLPVRIGRVFKLDEVAEAHRCMEENRAGGKLVVVT